MSQHLLFGQSGEKAAAAYLAGQGYNIVHRNYRYKRAEIDLIAQKEKLLVFVEVKTRKSDRYGFPEEAVNQKKTDLFLLAADHYIDQTNWQHDVRFDIISVTGNENNWHIHHIEDAFH